MQGAFFDRAKPNPIGLTLVIALHVAGLTAVILAKSEVIRDPITKLYTYAVPDRPPPPPFPPEPRTLKAKPTPAQIDRPVQQLVTRLAVPANVVVVPPKLPPLPDVPFGSAAEVQPAAHEPVLTEAAPDPRYAGAFQPAYPPSLMREEIEGKTVVRILVGVDGRVKAVEQLSATDAGFFEATRRQALARWRFTPATRDGVAIESWRTMTVRFTLAT